MNIEEQKHGAVTVIRPNGSVAGDDAQIFLQRSAELLQQNLGRLVIDASAINYIDSRGLEAFVDLSDRLADTGQALRVCSTTETLREIFDLTEIASFFELYADVNSAVRSFL